jgi:hypothetical protein
MPAFEQRLVVLVRGIRAFLNLQAGVTRAGEVSEPLQAWGHRDEQARRELERKDQELAELRARLARSGIETGAGGANPEKIVWIFGSGRTGSTWLSSMMGDIQGHALWGEPWVGTLFGNFYQSVDKRKHENDQFILGSHRESWLRSIRNFVLDAAAATFPDLARENYLVIKEPNGSIGAPLLMEALPESRMIFLVRDPRDVISSSMDAKSEGGWNYERNKHLYQERGRPPADKDPYTFSKKRAKNYMKVVGKAKEAYDAHRGPKVLVRYEELRSDTLGTMQRIYSTLGIEVDEEELARVVEKHSWENIPEEEKGKGKFYRKATPGGWREDLTPEQAESVERITAPLLEELYPHELRDEKRPQKSLS